MDIIFSEVKDMIDNQAATAIPVLTAQDIAGMIDHTLVSPEAPLEQIRQACETARQWKTASVYVRPSDVSMASEILKNSSTIVATVAGFPHGTTSTAGKLAEIRQAAQDGCKRIDMSINTGRLLSGDISYIRAEIASCTQQAHMLGMKIVIIFENQNLTPRQIIETCHICQETGVDFINTSSGFTVSGAKAEDVRLMRRNCLRPIGVKASGGIRDLDRALEMIASGATLIGTSTTIKIVEEARSLEKEGLLAGLWENSYNRIKRISVDNSREIGGDPGVKHETYYCPLLSKDILDELCMNITYATEGRLSREHVTEVTNWSAAERICADCVNAYWNKNDMPAPKLNEEKPE
jgi:deoxyribose-phosphate aldolase